MNRRKTLETMWVNVKVRQKIKEKAFMEGLKTFQPKTTLPLPSLPQPLTRASLLQPLTRASSLNNNAQTP